MQTLTKILERIGENFAWSTWMFGAPVDPRLFQRRPELRGSVHSRAPLDREESPWPSRG